MENPEIKDDNWEETESDDGHRDLYAAEFEGYGTYEDYEPNPYDGTYSEMQVFQKKGLTD